MYFCEGIDAANKINAIFVYFIKLLFKCNF